MLEPDYSATSSEIMSGNLGDEVLAQRSARGITLLRKAHMVSSQVFRLEALWIKAINRHCARTVR